MPCVGDRDRYLKAGMDDYVSKPIRINALMRALTGGASPPELPPTEPRIGSAVEAGRPALLDEDALAALKEVIGGDEAALAELIGSFLAEGPKLCARLAQAEADGDGVEIGRVAHTMKSSARDFGADELASLCLTLEQQAKAAARADTSALVAKVEAAYDQAQQALCALLRTESDREGNEA